MKCPYCLDSGCLMCGGPAKFSNEEMADRLLSKVLHAGRNRLLTVTNKEYDAILDEIEEYLKP